MLNYLWAGMILLGLIVGAINGRLGDIGNAALGSAKDAVSLCITMLGVTSMWTGLMKIAENSGLIAGLAERFEPLLGFLFPTLPKKCAAKRHIATNFIANIFGIGWAATPAGLKAMEELKKISPEKDRASIPMCTFMIINFSSLQLVSTNIITYRMQAGSANPSEIIGAGLIATLATTVLGIILAKLFEVGK